MSPLPYLMYQFKTTPIKIPAGLLEEIGNLMLKHLWKWKEPAITKTTLKKNTVGGLQTKSIVPEEFLVPLGIKSYLQLLSNALPPPGGTHSSHSTQLTVAPTWPPSRWHTLGFFLLFKSLRTYVFWRDCIMAVSPICSLFVYNNSSVGFVHPMKCLNNRYGNVCENDNKNFHKVLHRRWRNGPFAAISNTEK